MRDWEVCSDLVSMLSNCHASCGGQLTMGLLAQMILWYFSCRGISTARKPCKKRLGRTDSGCSFEHEDYYRQCSESASGGNFVSKSHSQVMISPQ